MLIIHRFLFALLSIHNAVLIFFFFFVVSLSSTFSTLYFCFFFLSFLSVDYLFGCFIC